MDRFLEMQCFVAVVERGGFTAAARQLNQAKSAVSRRVAELESRLGVTLLQRTTRRLHVTDAGQLFYRRAADLLQELDAAEQATTGSAVGLRGKLRVTAPLSFGLRHLGPALPAFMDLHPELQFELDLNDREVDLVQDGFDMAIRIGRLRDSSLVARRLGAIRRAAVASPDYLARHGTPGHPRDLADHSLLRYTLAADNQWRFDDRAGRTIQPEVHSRLAANNGELLAQVAVSGQGIALLPTFIVSPWIESGQLRIVLGNYRVGEEGLFSVYPPGRYRSQRVRVFSDFLAERFGQQPYWDDCLAAS